MKRTDSSWPAHKLAGLQQEQDDSTVSLDDFLASVERRAFIMAKLSTHDEDAALDIVQDAMLRMVQHYADKPADSWPPLFFRILGNRLTDHHRKRGFGRLLRWRGVNQEIEDDMSEAVDQLPHTSPTPDEALNSSCINDEVQRVLQKLPERQRQVFLLRHWQGMSVEETALTLKISGGSVKTHLSRAVRALRDKLKEYEPDESD